MPCYGVEIWIHRSIDLAWRAAMQRAAIWNCVYYNVHTYQQSILREMGEIIATAYAQVKPRESPVISAQEISNHLKSAVQVGVSLYSVCVYLCTVLLIVLARGFCNS